MLELDGVIVEFVPVETWDIFEWFRLLIEDGPFVFANHRLHRCVNNIPVLLISLFLPLTLSECVLSFKSRSNVFIIPFVICSDLLSDYPFACFNCPFRGKWLLVFSAKLFDPHLLGDLLEEAIFQDVVWGDEWSLSLIKHLLHKIFFKGRCFDFFFF